MTRSTLGQSNESAWRVVTERKFTVAPGVQFISSHLTRDVVVESVHRVEIDPTNPYVQLVPVCSGGKVNRLETVGNLMNEMDAQGKRVVAGFNGDFFSYRGVPSGLQITEGEIITSPATTKVMLAVKPDGTFVLEDSVSMNAELRFENGHKVPIDMLNRMRTLKHTDHAAVYTWRYGSSTRTPEGGTEVVVKSIIDRVKLIQGHPLQGTVHSIRDGANTPIEPDTWVVSLTGSKAEQFRKIISIGQRVSLHITYDKGIHEATQVISGNSTLAFVLLKHGKVPNSLKDLSIRYNSDRHPRTFMATKNGKLSIVAVDGRRPGYSDGMTLAECAEYMKQLGMDHAINLDGGGSTTCYIRQPGDESAVLINKPSDGFEREVGNALAVISNAPPSELEKLIITPDSAQALAGSSVSFAIKGHDRYLNGVPISSEQVRWSLQGDCGFINQTGIWTSGSHAASGMLTAHYGDIEQSIPVKVVDRIARLVMDPTEAILEPGGKCAFRMYAYDERDREIHISNELITWTVEDELGCIDAAGTLLAGEERTQGKVTATWGTVQTEAVVQVGKPHLIIADFEKLDFLDVSEENAVPGSVKLSKAARPSPVRFGTFSGKLTYDFTGQSGSSSVHVSILNDQGKIGREIEGKPYRFGLWVCGDGGGHWLRMGIEDSKGLKCTLDFTKPGGLDWKGWRYVYAEVPSGTEFPLRVHTISIVKINTANNSGGVVYLDNFRAEYVDFQEDVEGPLFSNMSPVGNEAVSAACPVIHVTVSDSGSGVDPASIRVWLNDTVIPHTFVMDQGLVVCMPEGELAAGHYRVVVEAADMERNAAIPPASWSFVIKQ